MQGKFKELLMKKAKEGKTISPEAAKEKMSVLEELTGMMGGEMADKLKGMKKVSVVAKDEEGLKAGLEKAEDVIEGSDEEEEYEMEEDYDSEDKDMDYDEYSKEELIKMLEEK